MSSISIPIENKRKSKVKIWVYSIRRNGLAIVFCLFCFGLVLFSKTNLTAAKDGLILWATAVVPSLFPFFVSTELLSYTSVIKYLGKWLNPIMRPLFNVPGEGAFAFLMGLISGYPVGAKVVSNFMEQGIVTKQEAERLLAFTNNSGPLFILGTVGISMFGNSTVGVLLLISHLLASITVGIIFRFWKANVKQPSIANSSYKNSNDNISLSNLGGIIGNSITNSINTILLIGGFVVLFSVIISILQNSQLLNVLTTFLSPIFSFLHIPEKFTSGFISGILELTNGLNIICNLPEKHLTYNIILASFLLGLGGLSVLLQVWSTIAKTDLSIKPYILGKLLHACISALYTFLLIKSFIVFNFDLRIKRSICLFDLLTIFNHIF